MFSLARISIATSQLMPCFAPVVFGIQERCQRSCFWIICNFIGRVSVSERLQRGWGRKWQEWWREIEKREQWIGSGLLNRTSLISFSRFHAWHRLIKRALLRSYVIGDMEKLWRAVFPQLDSCWVSTSRPAVTPRDPGSVINYMCQSYVWLPPVCQSWIWSLTYRYKQPTSRKRLTRFKNTRQDFCPQYMYIKGIMCLLKKTNVQ